MRRTLPLLALLLSSLVQAQEGPPSGWVVLSLDEYRSLRAKAEPPERELARPPVDAAVTRVDYDLRLEGPSAVGEARLQLDVFRDGYVGVGVPDGLLVGGARLDGRQVALVELPATGGGPAVLKDARRQVLLSKTGTQQLVLDVVLPIGAQAGSELLALPPAPGVISRLTLLVPRTGVEPGVADGLLLESAEAAGQTRLVAATRPGGSLTLSWRRRREDTRAAQPLRYRGSVTTVVGLGEDVAQVQAEVRVSVLQGQASQLRLALPPGLLVNDVSGALVADWQARDGQLEVRLLEPLEGEGAFTLAAEQRVAREGRLAVPLLRLPEAERETGGVAVEVAGAGEIEAPAQSGLDDADPSELGGPVAGRDAPPSLVAFRYRPQAGQAPRSLEVEVKRYTPEEVQVATVSEARHRVLLSEQGRRLVQSRWAVRNNQERFLAVTLPAGATLWSAAVGGRPVRPGQDPNGQLLLPLPKGRPGDEAPTSAVEVVYVEGGPAFSPQGRVSFKLPATSLPVQRTGVELRHPPGYALTPEAGGLRGAAFAPPGEAVLRGDLSAPAEAPRPAAPPAKADKKSEEAVQELVGKLKDGRATRRAGSLPLRVPFPAVGPLLYLAEDLTPEGSLPAVELRYERGKE